EISDATISITSSFTKVCDGSTNGFRIYPDQYEDVVNAPDQRWTFGYTAGASEQIKYMFVDISFQNSHVGSYGAVNLIAQLGSSQGSYHLNYGLIYSQVVGSIAKKVLDIDIHTISKTYNGTDLVETADYDVYGIVPSDTNYNGVEAHYFNAHVGAGKSVSFSIVDLVEFDDHIISDYSLSSAITGVGEINKAVLTVTNTGISKVYNG
ncbi:MAG: hypothetical protein EZS28_055241, partial [Streblomastix strix]